MLTENTLIIITLVITLITLGVLIFKSSKKENFDMTTYKYFPYLYGQNTDACGHLYTDKGMQYMDRYEMCMNNPDLAVCDAMFQMGL